ncbi:beta-L-arabinofuranosidase domain-containing protein [Actinomadura opuntiae]|uniref:beta-L-arabinofuranosidase domain-containing protein n=1 Tax=Actinomadura sp. OS1-43 TaxID=604315 RepID=UPI00255AD176|nr:beta-L-arabinofuranosidase domain-containing protein [Actinomadura sp. OS1-43]MDL4821825.1 glycoside hydrolase family 127 protein [Actinomadura sp. OS1-43]
MPSPSPVSPAAPLPDDSPDPRIAASWRRLQKDDYDVDPVLHDGMTGEWPADLPGRLILGLSRLAAVTGRAPRRLQDLVEALPSRLNAAGYLGPVHRDATDEQQLAGHGWLVSGLLAHHRLTRDDRSRQLALDIVGSLFLPAASRLPDYPRRRRGDDTGAGASGRVIGRKRRWLLSSDTYCVFIALEGLVAAYSETFDQAIADAIEELAGLVDRDDLVAARAQLHATLTAARCLHAFHELTGSAAVLATARRLYELYAAHGRTANSATWNWFGRADSWTEPCAVADSLILALGLWRTTGDIRYLDDAHAIEHNGLGHAQKPNGGFGLDAITGPGRPWLSNVHPDAAWCCSMRGAVALAELQERSYSVTPGSAPADSGRAADTLGIDLYRDGIARLDLPAGALVLRQRTGYPVSGRTMIEVLRSDLGRPLRIRFMLPSWTDPARTTTTVRADGPATQEEPGQFITTPAAGDRYSIDFPVNLRVRPESGDMRALTLRHGVLLLGAEGADGADPTLPPPAHIDFADPWRARYRHGHRQFSPVRDVFERSGDAATGFRARVVFVPGSR